MPRAKPPLWWHERAACRGAGPGLFYEPLEDDDGLVVDVQALLAEAVAVCAACPVRWSCLLAAVERGERFGVWGGLTTDERDRTYARPVVVAA